MSYKSETNVNEFSRECVCYNYQRCALKSGNSDYRKCDMKIPNSERCPLYQMLTNPFGKYEEVLEERVIN